MSSPNKRFKLTYQVKLTFLHYLRYLLRECTYLPDPAARRYFHSFILERFREYRPRAPKSTEFSWPPKRRVIQDAHRQTHLLQTCRKALSTLHRANAGVQVCLTGVLYRTYGRSGKRRHELLHPYLQPDVPDNSEALRELATAVPDPADQGVPKISKAVEVIAKAQSKQRSTKLSRPPINKIHPVIPKTNSWGLPMPLKRVRNMKRRGYQDLIEKILPPLPLNEWERLRDLSTGKIAFQGLIRRRGDASPVSNIVIGRRHEITARFMQRLWAKIFDQCSVMNRDTAKGTLKVQWGNWEAAAPIVMDADTGKDMFLFESANEPSKESLPL